MGSKNKNLLAYFYVLLSGTILSIISLIAACNFNSKSKNTLPEFLTKSKSDIIISRTKDSISFSVPVLTHFAFGIEELSDIINSHPEFSVFPPKNPDEAYWSNNTGFDSEFGRDDYYLLYYALLRSKNNIAERDFERTQLINLFSTINEIFAIAKNGGSYFGHQKARIFAYTEFCIQTSGSKEKSSEQKFSEKKNSVLNELRIALLKINEDPAKIQQMEFLLDKLNTQLVNSFLVDQVTWFIKNNYEYDSNKT